MPYYLIDDNKNKVEVTNIENNLFRTVLAKIHSEVNNNDYAIEFVTQAQFNQLEANEDLQPRTYYFITDDTTEEDIDEHLNNIDEDVSSLGNRVEALEDKKLYQHDIIIFGYDENTNYNFAISFRLLTNGNHTTINEDIDDILEVIEELYGEAYLPVSGEVADTSKRITICSLQQQSNLEAFLVFYLDPSEGTFENISFYAESVTFVSVKTIKLI